MEKEKQRCWAQVGEDWCTKTAVKGSEYCSKHKKEFFGCHDCGCSDIHCKPCATGLCEHD